MHGVVQKKVADFGDRFLSVICEFCQAKQLSQDVKPSASDATVSVGSTSASALAAFEHFESGKSVREVAQLLGRAETTTRSYLAHFIRLRKITDPNRWVDETPVSRIREAVFEHGLGPLNQFSFRSTRKLVMTRFAP